MQTAQQFDDYIRDTDYLNQGNYSRLALSITIIVVLSYNQTLINNLPPEWFSHQTKSLLKNFIIPIAALLILGKYVLNTNPFQAFRAHGERIEAISHYKGNATLTDTTSLRNSGQDAELAELNKFICVTSQEMQAFLDKFSGVADADDEKTIAARSSIKLKRR